MWFTKSVRCYHSNDNNREIKLKPNPYDKFFSAPAALVDVAELELPELEVVDIFWTNPAAAEELVEEEDDSSVSSLEPAVVVVEADPELLPVEVELDLDEDEVDEEEEEEELSSGVLSSKPELS